MDADGRKWEREEEELRINKNPKPFVGGNRATHDLLPHWAGLTVDVQLAKFVNFATRRPAKPLHAAHKYALRFVMGKTAC